MKNESEVNNNKPDQLGSVQVGKGKWKMMEERSRERYYAKRPKQRKGVRCVVCTFGTGLHRRVEDVSRTC